MFLLVSQQFQFLDLYRFPRTGHNYHQSVLFKGRYFIASAGTQAAVLLKADLPPQTQEPRLQFYQGLNRCSSFLLLSTPHSLSLSSASERTLKDPKGTNVEVSRVDLANWALRTSPKFTTGVIYQFHQISHENTIR